MTDNLANELLATRLAELPPLALLWKYLKDALRDRAEYQRMAEQTEHGQQSLNEALGVVGSLVRQHCCLDENGLYDSLCIAANAEAMELLAEHGQFEITSGSARRIFGQFKNE